MTAQYETTLRTLMSLARQVDVERVTLEHCWQRVLAEDIYAGMDFPPFDRAQVDGYAVIAEETATASLMTPLALTEIGTRMAGEAAPLTLRPGTACRIMTGSPLPAGATAVLRFEDVRRVERTVYLVRPAGRGENTNLRGASVARGDKVLSAGRTIDRGMAGRLALLGRCAPLVFRRPRVGILATGTEVTRVGARLEPGRVYDVNSYMLAAQTLEAGADPVLLGVAPDDPEAIAARLDAATDCDLLVTTGGVSAGDRDLTERVFRALGVALRPETTRRQPGLFFLAGERAGQVFVGLSGNPAAAGISFEQFVNPVLLKMGGRENWRRRSLMGKMAAPFASGPDAKRLAWAHSWVDNDELYAEPLPLKWTEMTKSALSANALVAMGNEQEPPDGVEVILLH